MASLLDPCKVMSHATSCQAKPLLSQQDFCLKHAAKNRDKSTFHHQDAPENTNTFKTSKHSDSTVISAAIQGSKLIQEEKQFHLLLQIKDSCGQGSALMKVTKGRLFPSFSLPSPSFLSFHPGSQLVCQSFPAGSSLPINYSIS